MALNLGLFFESVVREHTDVFFVLQGKNNQLIYINPIIEKVLGWGDIDLVKRETIFDQLLVRPKRWKLIRKEIDSHSDKGEFYSFTEELKSSKEDVLACNFKMKRVLFESEEYVFGEIIFSNSNNEQGLIDKANTLMLRNTSLMRDVNFNKYVYDLIFKIQRTENINDIISAVCNRLVERDKSEFSVELVQLFVLKNDHMHIEFSTTASESDIRNFSLLGRVESFLKTASIGEVLRDGTGGLALAINLFDLDHLDAVMAIKTHSEEQLIKELAEIKVIVNSMARQINTVYLTNRLRKESIEDPLTGVFNRRYFDKSIRDEVNRADRHKRDLSLIFMDIDFFKKVNDVYGHAQGDMCLKEAAKMVHATGRASDQVFRYGGEEFVVLLPETNFQQAMIRSEKIREMIQNTPFTNIADTQKPLKVTVSLGVSEYKPGQNIESFINSADDALYQAKSSGRNRSVGAK